MVECEDAIATNEIDYRFAAADGATESYGARKWARYLATSWVSSTSRGADDAAYLTGLARVAEHFRSKQPRGRCPGMLPRKPSRAHSPPFSGLLSSRWSRVTGTGRPSQSAIAASSTCEQMDLRLPFR